MFKLQSVIIATVLLLACIPAAVAIFGAPSRASVDDSAAGDDDISATVNKILANSQHQCSEHMEIAVLKAIANARRSCATYLNDTVRAAVEAAQQKFMDQLDDRCYAKLDEIEARVPFVEDVFRFTPGDWFNLSVACIVLYYVGRKVVEREVGAGKLWTVETLETKTPEQIDRYVHYAAYQRHAADTSSSSAPVSAALVPCTPGEFEQLVEEKVQKRTSCLFKIDFLVLVYGIVIATVAGAVWYRVTRKEPQPDSSMWDRFLVRVTDLIAGYVIGQTETTSDWINSMVAKCFSWLLHASGSIGFAALRIAVEFGFLPRIFRVCLKPRRSGTHVRASAIVAPDNAVAPGGPQGPVPASRRRQAPSAPETSSLDVEHIPRDRDEGQHSASFRFRASAPEMVDVSDDEQ